MLGACAPYARWADVFCERGAFDADEAPAVLAAAARPGCAPGCTPTSWARGRRPARGRTRAAAADHCTHLTDGDVDALPPDRVRDRGDAAAGRVLDPVALSGRPPAARCRRDGGPGHRLQPGLVLFTSMPLAIALAVREMRMTPAEAVRAATAGARARCAATTSAPSRGRAADLIVLDAPSYLPGLPPGRPAGPRRLAIRPPRALGPTGSGDPSGSGVSVPGNTVNVGHNATRPLHV